MSAAEAALPPARRSAARFVSTAFMLPPLAAGLMALPRTMRENIWRAAESPGAWESVPLLILEAQWAVALGFAALFAFWVRGWGDEAVFRGAWAAPVLYLFVWVPLWSIPPALIRGNGNAVGEALAFPVVMLIFGFPYVLGLFGYVLAVHALYHNSPSPEVPDVR